MNAPGKSRRVVDPGWSGARLTLVKDCFRNRFPHGVNNDCGGDKTNQSAKHKEPEYEVGNGRVRRERQKELEVFSVFDTKKQSDGAPDCSAENKDEQAGEGSQEISAPGWLRNR